MLSQIDLGVANRLGGGGGRTVTSDDDCSCYIYFKSLILAIPAKYRRARARKWAPFPWRVSSREPIFARASVFRRNRQN